MKRALGSGAVLLVLVLSANCTHELTCPCETADIPNMTYIDQPILLEASEPILPRSAGSGFFLFDFSAVELVQNGTYTDFELQYTPSTTCPEDVWVFNFASDTWQNVIESPDPSTQRVPIQEGIPQFQLFSTRGLIVKDLLDTSELLQLFSRTVSEPQMRALHVRSDYFWARMPVETKGLTYDRGALWASSAGAWSAQRLHKNNICKLSLGGEILDEFEVNACVWQARGLDSDGENLWLADRASAIFRIGWDGSVLDSIRAPTPGHGGLACGQGSLWLSTNAPYGSRAYMYRIDPAASCVAHDAVVMDEFPLRFWATPAVAWKDGALLLASGDSLYEVSSSGTVLQTWLLPVEYVQEIAWGVDVLWVVSGGPRNVRGSDPVLNVFRLR